MLTLRTDRRYSRLVVNTYKNFERVKRLREVARAGVKDATKTFFDKNLDFARFTDGLSGDNTKEHELQQRAMDQALGEIGDAQAVVDAASLVLSHSMLEDVVSECLFVSAEAAPDEWDSAIHDRKVALGEVAKRSYEELRAALLSQYIEQDLLRNKPLDKRLAILLGKLPIWPTKQDSWSREGYRYDQERIAALDRLRQDIVHKVQIPVRENTESDLKFLKDTALLLCDAVRDQYGLMLDLRKEGGGA